MPFYDVLCEACGLEEERLTKVDDRNAPCSACGASTTRIWKANRGSRHADVTWPGGKVFENGFDSPQTFYSPKEYRDALAAKGLTVRGDGEETGAAISAQALKEAEALMLRMYPDAGCAR